MKQGAQILADFKNCKTTKELFLNLKILKKKVGDIIKKSGFKIVRHCSHKFGDGGVSLVFLVSESHVAIHTWPENNSINIDIFFCNYTKDNSKKGEAAFKMLFDLYKPARVIKKSVKRFY
jgi:spermidine synthase